VQAQVLELLADLQRDLGLAMIFITHDLSVLTSVCERLAVMYAGKIIEEGPGKEVFAHAAHPYTRALVGAFPTVGDPKARMAPSGLGGDPPDPTDVPSGCSFHPRCPDVRPECSGIDVELWAAPTGGRAACIEVQPGRANA
jgi:peptide/nickel transport system ATP-binding protein